MNFIDLKSNLVFTEAQITHRVVAMLRSLYSVDDEQFYSRILHGTTLGTYQMPPDELAEVRAYQIHVEECREAGRMARIDNDLLQRTIQYERAVERLKRYRLVDGLPEQLAFDAIYDTETGRLVSPAIPYIAAIEPLPEMLNNITEEGISVTIRNPLVYIDEKERNEAQSIINIASIAILELVEARKSS